jgi:hypothetical protein
METVESLETLEAVLTEERGFGDSNYIRAQLHASYERRLAKITARLPVAGQLVEALERASSDRRLC